MKTDITIRRGLVSEAVGDGIYIDGKEYHNAPFDNRWEHFSGDIFEGTGAAALTYEAYRDTGFFMRFFRSTQADALFCVYSLPQAWNPSTSVVPHIHCVPMASGSGVVRFNWSYVWARSNEKFPPTSGWTSGSLSASWTPALQYNHVTLPLGSITPITSSDEAALLVLKLERSAGTDTYLTSKDHGTPSANVGLLKFDLAVQLNKAGTIYTFGSSSSPT
jgi:hypothetical protein